MKWKDKILKQKEQGRIPEEYFGLIVSTVEQAIIEQKIELIDGLNNLYEEGRTKRDSISSQNITSYFARLETIQEILKLITK